MEHLLAGFLAALSPVNLLLIVVGCFAGIAFGALPGISSAMGCVLMLPFTYGMDPISGLILLISVFCGATYGGSITAILFNTPGTPAAAMTTLDGYKLHEKGQGGKALGIGISCSVLGGIFSTFILLLLSPPLAAVALSFGPAEYAALAILGLAAIVGLSPKSMVKGLISCGLGLVLATFGSDMISGADRFTFGTPLLLNGVHFIPVMIGAFAVAEVFQQIARRTTGQALKISKVKISLMTWKEFLVLKWIIIRSAIIGVVIGILPGTGGTIASVLAYSDAARVSKTPELLGTGIIDGVAAAETSNNASVGGAMVPTLTLGIPGSGTTAVMLGAFIIMGLRPGPLLLREQPLMLYAIFAAMFIANLLLFAGGVVGVKTFAQISRLPYAIQAPLILGLCFIGSYALNNDLGAVWVMLFFGVVGYYMKKYQFSVAGMVLGLVLGELLEMGVRKALLISQGNWSAIFLRPIAGPIFLAAFISLLWPLIKKQLPKKEKTGAKA